MDSCSSMNAQTISGYDSDETIVDGSLSGSDVEDDLHLKRLFNIGNTSLSPPSSILLTNGFHGQMSPEIQSLGKLVKGTQIETASSTQVCDKPPEEEPSQSLLRNWTEVSSHNGSQTALNSDGSFCEHHVEDTHFSGMCEDSQYLVPASQADIDEGDSPEVRLLIGVEQKSYPKNELKEAVEEGTLHLSNLKNISADCKVKFISKEVQSLLQYSEDYDTHKDLPKYISSNSSINELMKPIDAPGSMTEMAGEIGDSTYLSFKEETAEGSGGLSSKTVNAMQCPEIDQLQHNIEKDSILCEEQAILNNVSSDNETLISSLASVQDGNEYRTKEECKTSLQNTEQADSSEDNTPDIGLMLDVTIGKGSPETAEEEEKLQLSTLEKICKNYEVKAVCEETQTLLKQSEDSEIHNDLLKCISSQPSNGELLKQLGTSESLTEMAREIGDLNYRSFINETAEGSSGLSSDLVNAIDSMENPKIHQVQHNTGDPSLPEEQEMEKHKPLKVTNILSHSQCSSHRDELIDEQLLHSDSRLNCTLTVNDQSDTSGSHLIPSVLIRVDRATSGHCSDDCEIAITRGQGVDGKVFSTKAEEERQPTATPEGLQTVNSLCVPSASQNIPDIGKDAKNLRENRSSDRKRATQRAEHNFRNFTEPKHKRRKYADDTISEELATMKITHNRRSGQCSPSVASPYTVSVSKTRKNHTAGISTRNQTTQPQKEVKKTNSTEDKSNNKVFRKSVKRKQSDCNFCCNELREDTTSLSRTSFTSQHHCTRSSTKALVTNVHKRNYAGETQLHKAAKRGDLVQVTELIEAGINVNQSDYAGWTAIHEASCKGFLKIVLALLEMGADVHSKGPDGILPIHDAVVGNHFKTAELLLKFGADPYARDNNHKNAFDKCRDDKMTELLKSHCQAKSKNCVAESEVTQEVSIHSTPVIGTRRRRKCSMKNMTILQEAESKQNKLLATELHTPEDADKYVEEMNHIQGVLNDIAKQQKNERDTLAKKYRASMDSFKQGILRDKLAQLACRQKSLLQLVHNQKRVPLKIIAYQQMKRSHCNKNGQDSSSHHCAKSPGRNPISGLLTHNEGHNANCTNGSTMATKMPAVSRVPDFESEKFQAAFMGYISSSEINGTRDVPVGVLASERTGQRYSNSTSEDIPLGTENALLGLNPYFRLTPADLSTTDDQLETAEPRNRSHYSILVNSTINITDKSNVTVKTLNHQAIDERQQNSNTCQPLESPNSEMPNQQADRSFSVAFGGTLENGRTQLDVSRQTSTNLDHRMNSQTVNIQAHKKQQIRVDSERKTRKVSLRKLISMGKIKPGKDTLLFQLQDYNHKASLLPDGTIRDPSGEIHRNVVSWIKALLGNDISVSWKYVANKVTYCGKKLLSFMTQEDFAPKELNNPLLQSHTASFSNHHSPVHTVLQVKDILLFDKSDFFPSHIMDQIWDEFLNKDELDL